jgi:hypothetical protein
MDSIWVIFLLVVAVGLIVLGIKIPTKKKDSLASIETFENQITGLLQLRAAVEKGSSDDPLSLNQDEVLVGVIQASLLEYKKGARRFESGSVGGGAAIGGGLFVGGSKTKGVSTQDPDSLEIKDTGVAKFTTQRVLFSGASDVRVWDLSKLVDFELGPNAINVMLKVSNSKTVSGLQYANTYALFPGFVWGAAYAYAKKGKNAALSQIDDFLEQIQFAKASLERNPKAQDLMTGYKKSK